MMRRAIRNCVVACALAWAGVSAFAADETLSQQPLPAPVAPRAAPALRPPSVAPALRLPPAAAKASAPAAATRTRVPYAPDALEPLPAARRSVAVDRESADRLSVMHDDASTIRLFVEGENPDRPAQPKSFERRFSDALNGDRAPSSIRFSQKVLDTTPCPSIASAGTPFGPAYNAYGFCP